MTEERTVGGIGCFEVLGHLSDYVDGEASSDVARKIEAHLRGCDACEKFGGEFAGVIKALRQTLGADGPVEPDVSARLRDRLGLKKIDRA